MMTELEFADQYTRHSLAVQKLISYKFGAEHAEDIVSEAWLKAWRARDTFRGESEFKTWVVRIAVNNALELRRKRVTRSEVALTPQLLALQDDANVVERSLMASDQLRVVMCLAPSSNDLELFNMRFVDGMPYMDISLATGACVATVKTKVNRFRIKLTKNFAK